MVWFTIHVDNFFNFNFILEFLFLKNFILEIILIFFVLEIFRLSFSLKSILNKFWVTILINNSNPELRRKFNFLFILPLHLRFEWKVLYLHISFNRKKHVFIFLQWRHCFRFSCCLFIYAKPFVLSLSQFYLFIIWFATAFTIRKHFYGLLGVNNNFGHFFLLVLNYLFWYWLNIVLSVFFPSPGLVENFINKLCFDAIINENQRFLFLLLFLSLTRHDDFVFYDNHKN